MKSLSTIFITIVAILSLLFIISACDLVPGGDTTDGDGTGDQELSVDNPDDQGNLVVINYAETKLVLFNGSDRVKILPDSSTDFLVEIANPNSVALDLRIYKYNDILSTIDDPSVSDVYKRWNVVLAPDNDVANRSTWIVRMDDAETISGTLTLSYIGGTTNSVDVFLNGQTGAKIASLSPGQQNRKVGVDYGNYTAHYHYWYSDPNTASGVADVGWIETEIVNTDEVPIYIILNADRPERHLQIPHWNGGSAIESQYGTILIQNNKSVPVQIWVGSQLIEQIMYTDMPVQNYSTIPANDQIEYTLEAGDYTFSAKDLVSGATYATQSLTIIAEQQESWAISN